MFERTPAAGRGAARVATARFGALGLQAVTLVLLARWLGTQAFGVFSLALAVQSLVTVVANLGILTASQYHTGKGTSPERVVTAALVATVVGTLVLAPPASFVLSWLHPWLLPDLPLDLLVLAIVAGPVRLAFETLLGAFIGTGRIEAQVRSAFVAPGSLLVLVGLVLIVGRLDAATAVEAWLLSQIVSLAYALRLFGATERVMAPRAIIGDRGLWREVVRVGIPGYFIYLMYWAAMRLDRFAFNAAGGVEVLAPYALAAWVAESFILLPTAIANVIFPRMANEDVVAANELTTRGVRTTLLVAAGLVPPALIGMWLIAHLLGGSVLAEALVILVVILPGYILFTPVAVFTSYLTARGRISLAAAYYAAVAFTKVVAIVAFYRAAGPTGGILAIAVVSAAGGIVAALHMSRLFGRSLASVLVPGRADVARVASLVTVR